MEPSQTLYRTIKQILEDPYRSFQGPLTNPYRTSWKYAKALQPVLLGRLDPPQPARGAVPDGPLLSEGPRVQGLEGVPKHLHSRSVGCGTSWSTPFGRTARPHLMFTVA